MRPLLNAVIISSLIAFVAGVLDSGVMWVWPQDTRSFASAVFCFSMFFTAIGFVIHADRDGGK